MDKLCPGLARWIGMAGALCCALVSRAAQGDFGEQLRSLQRQNESLKQQLQQQQSLIDDLSRKVTELQEGRSPEPMRPQSAGTSGGFKLGRVHLGGEGGAAFFRSEGNGAFPNSEFRIDEAKLFVEAPIWEDIYVFSEIDMLTREGEEYFHIGELYVDFENISRLWNRDNQMSLRVGRFDIPFGEEYRTRDAIDNPLISHSLIDLWGVDEGVELYGHAGPIRYVVAVQNGGHPSLRDFNEDKALTARISYEPTRWLYLSGSAMRTGALDAEDDFVSELWVGNGFVRSIGAPDTTTTFQANVFEGDVHLRWKSGHLKGAGGYLNYDDNDSAANNRRELYYYYVEGLQHLTPKLYAASRWSQIMARKGFPLVGNGDFVEYFFYDLATDLWRWSLGMGYRWSPNLLLKAEYTFEEGETVDGEKRKHLNMMAVEVAYRF